MKGHREILIGFENALKERGMKYSIAFDIDTEDNDAVCFSRTKEALEKDKEINTVFISTAGYKGALDAIEKKKSETNANGEVKLDDVSRVKVLSPTMQVFKRFIRNTILL